MEKTRAKKGEGYWFIFRTKGGGFVVNYKIEEGSSDDDARFDIGNYFVVKDEALFMARKLRAVLKGADVIDVTTANVGSADELDAKKHQIELILSHRQTIVIAENKGAINWCWNTKSIESRNEMLETTIRANNLKFYGAILDRYDPR